MAGKDLASVTGELAEFAGRLERCSGVADFLELPAASADSISALPACLKPVAGSLEVRIHGAGRALSLLIAAVRELHDAFALLTPAEKEELRRLVLGFEFWRDEWPDYPVQRMIELAERVDHARITTAAACLAQCAELIRESGVENPPDSVLSSGTPWGEIILGTSGKDHYRSRALLIIDPGGDDTYEIPGGAWPQASVIVDLGGDDTYESPEGQAPGGAVCGVSWLEDVSGNDNYSAGKFSLGCGVLGAGMLVDRAGDDVYESSMLTQGAAFYGIGALLDLDGDDTYRAEFGAQGACFGLGSTVLADLAGNDIYFAGGVHRDYRSPGATKSFAQGCAAGIRPFTWGGRAALFDRAGNDRLEIGFLGQGAGYWGGLGVLSSGGDSSTCVAETYAQGCGVHFGVGALLDSGGNDSYTLEGVGQGAAEDRAWGLMIESGGNDSYTSVRMARGAGGTGGVGVLLEMEGNDSYPAAGQVTGGAGSRTWELPGIGLIIDMGGNDTYLDGFENGQTEGKSAWGARLDF